IGNRCDPDISDAGGACLVDFFDVDEFRNAFLTSPGHPDWNPDADLIGGGGPPDGIITFQDIAILKDFFLEPPGPSASGCN
ncbi:MAG: hypothetical protein OEQ74_07740, partial [Gammaproteobacteria bacterium]|nr:hypothetical protein [Gammaproteobacteria bacterium]